MKKFIKQPSCRVAAAAIVIARFGTAQAGHRHRNNDDAWVAGRVGLAAGALIGSAIASPPPPRYYGERVYIDPEPDYYEPRPVYRPVRRDLRPRALDTGLVIAIARSAIARSIRTPNLRRL